MDVLRILSASQIIDKKLGLSNSDNVIIYKSCFPILICISNFENDNKLHKEIRRR